MGPSKKRRRFRYSVLFTRTFSTLLAGHLDYYKKFSSSYPQELLKKLKEKCLPQLLKFPDSGRLIEDLGILQGFRDSPVIDVLLKGIHVEKENLNLREIVLDRNFVVLYGFNHRHVVFLSIKHSARKEYQM